MKVMTMDVWLDVALYSVVSFIVASLLHFTSLLPFSACFFPFCALSFTACFLRATWEVPTTGKTVLITGCDTGFGFNVAQRLLAKGFRVIACCLSLDGEGAKTLRSLGSPRMHTIHMDVTSAEHIRRAVEEVEQLIPAGEVLWGVVNNAGISTFGEVEWVAVDSFRRLLEVNVVGTVAVTKAFLPMLRQSKGRVVNVASMFGRMGAAGRGSYALTKYAVEGFSDCLRNEMRRWGVSVSMIEPGNYVAATNIFTDESVRAHGETMWENMTKRVQTEYTRDYFMASVNRMLGYTKRGRTGVTEVVEAMTASLTHVYPRARYCPMDSLERLKVSVSTHLPEYIYDPFFGSNAIKDHPAKKNKI